MREIADSTVAMTAYNWLAVQRGGRTLAEIAAGVGQWAAESRVDVDAEQVRSAVGSLVSRGWLRANPVPGGPVFDVKDAQRRPVSKRERTGDGWSGWRVLARSAAPVPTVALDEVAR